jgi:FemAB-related protein (PEP-CTERM system-associated)
MMEAATSSHVDVCSTALAPVRVRPFVPGDATNWDRFVDACPDATFFHRIGWRDIVSGVFRHRPHYLVAERGGAMCGLLPLAETKSHLFGHALVSLPFCVYGGPITTDTIAEEALIDAADELGRSLRVEHLELRNRRTLRADWPRQDLYVTFRKELAASPGDNMLAIPRKQRAMVRKAIGRGLRSEIDATCHRFFELYADNVHRHGTPALPRRYFAALLATFGDACEVMTVTDDDGIPISGVLSFYFRDEVLPYYAGDVARARDLAANDFKYWELMRRACERGVRIFDYGRSKRGTGSFDFKKNWGFEAEPLAYEYHLYKGDAIPQHNPLNPRYRAFIALWRHLPRAIANALGPSIVRGLG